MAIMCFLAHLPAVAASPPTVLAQIKVEATPAKLVFALGEPVEVKIRIENKSNNPIVLWAELFEPSTNVYCIGNDRGTVVSLEKPGGFISKRDNPTWQSQGGPRLQRPLGPGKVIEQSLILNTGFDFLSPGSSTFSIPLSLNSDDGMPLPILIVLERNPKRVCEAILENANALRQLTRAPALDEPALDNIEHEKRRLVGLLNSYDTDVSIPCLAALMSDKLLAAHGVTPAKTIAQQATPLALATLQKWADSPEPWIAAAAREGLKNCHVIAASEYISMP